MWHVGFFLVLLSFGTAQAESLSKIFKDRYFQNYEEGSCGKNAMDFIRAAAAAEHDARELYLVSIENKGFSVFGLVNAEAARGSRFQKPFEEETNWYHHAWVVDSEGRVYDFDYRIRPSIVPIKKYIETMFLDERECQIKPPPYGEFCVGREEKLRDYEVSVVRGDDVVADTEAPRETKATLKEFLKNWRRLLKQAASM